MPAFITDCCGCHSTPEIKHPTLAKIYLEDPGISYYQAFCSVSELAEACLATPYGVMAIDKRLYSRGKDLMVRYSSESATCFHRVATLIIDEKNVIDDFIPVERDIRKDMFTPTWSCEELQRLANQLELGREVLDIMP